MTVRRKSTLLVPILVSKKMGYAIPLLSYPRVQMSEAEETSMGRGTV